MNVVELFAGAGGATLGISRALPGAEHYAVELDPHAAAVWRAAFPNDTMDECDVETWLNRNGDRLPDTTYMKPDLLWSSPPCQMHSRAGNGTGYNGWPATFAAIRRLQPKYVIIENVLGAPAEEWAQEIALCGYATSVWRLDAADFGVPQRRRRLFVVAKRGAVIGDLTPPAPTHGPGRPLPWVTIREALEMPSGVAGVGGGTNPRHPGGVRTERDLTDEPSTTVATVAGNQAIAIVRGRDASAEPAPTITSNTAGRGGTSDRGNFGTVIVETTHPAWWHRQNDLDEPSRTAGAAGNNALPVASWFHPLDPDRKEITYPPGWGRAATEPERLDSPSPCVSATEAKGTNYRKDGSGPQGGPPRASDALFLATGRRRATPFENARLQGFPDGYPWGARPKVHRYRMIGNSVPPKLAEVVVRTLVG